MRVIYQVRRRCVVVGCFDGLTLFEGAKLGASDSLASDTLAVGEELESPDGLLVVTETVGALAGLVEGALLG